MTPSNAFAPQSADFPRRALSRHARALALFHEGLARYEEIRLQRPDDLTLGRYHRARFFLAAARQGLYAGGVLTFQQLLIDAAKPLRGAVEASFGAFHVYHDPSAWTRWKERPTAAECSRETREVRRAVAREFSVVALQKEVRAWSPALGAAGVNLYEELNDVGAHFHYRALRIIDGPDEAEVQEAFRRLARTGVICLRMLELLYAGIWNDRVLSERVRKFTGSL